ncbi:hypothetical protein GLYMA_14G161866v4 [Glycine max]|nr:hypothetical protein GLYMA_14G161866v4 [Glycine max]
MLSELRIVLGLILHLSSFSTVRNRTPQRQEYKSSMRNVLSSQSLKFRMALQSGTWGMLPD